MKGELRLGEILKPSHSIERLLSRVDLPMPLKNFIAKISQIYNLGRIFSYEPLPVGYEECNIKLNTEKGYFVLKIFSKHKKEKTIRDNIKGLLRFSLQGIPVPKLLRANGKFLQKIGKTFFCVMEFIGGHDLVKKKISKMDFCTIISYMVKIHRIKLKINRNYDSWGTANVLMEFHLKKKYLSKEDLKLVEPVVKDFKKIDFSKFRKCIIHGDLQREHIMKSKGKFYILDLGCMDYNLAAIDLAIFTGLFLPIESVKKSREIFNFVIKEYLKHNKLSKCELNTIPLLIRATYAIYLIASKYYLKNVERDKGSISWLAFARRGLKQSQKIFAR